MHHRRTRVWSLSTQGIYYTTLGGAPKVCGYVRVCNTLPYFGMADELTKLALRPKKLVRKREGVRTNTRGKACRMSVPCWLVCRHLRNDVPVGESVSDQESGSEARGKRLCRTVTSVELTRADKSNVFKASTVLCRRQCYGRGGSSFEPSMVGGNTKNV